MLQGQARTYKRPFWQRMSQGNDNTNDLFSDHPSDAKRIAALQRQMPEALKYYTAAVPAINQSKPAKVSNTKDKKKRRR